MAKVTGGMGTPPPPEAPVETTAPLSPDLIAQHLATARANEKELAPLTFGPALPVTSSIKPPDIPLVKAPRREKGPSTDALNQDVFGDVPSEVPAAVPAQDPAPAVKEVAPRRPEASASDPESPARGLPTAATDLGKQVTGGFGDLAQEYFPLDGNELRNACLSVMDDLVKHIENDLRFSVALCYPRIAVRLELHVEAYADDQNFVIPKVYADEGKTPLETAKTRADEVVFVVTRKMVEMTDDGESVNPPNKVRLDLGMPVPRRQPVSTPTGTMLVDVPNP